MKDKEFKVLNDGLIKVIDYMGDDAAVVQAARVSYGAGTKTPSDDRTLIRYLMRNWHTTPFEMCEVKLLVRVPMDCWRQWIRHRTASVNEYSTRYSEAIDSFEVASEWRRQSQNNKQGSSNNLITEFPIGTEDIITSQYNPHEFLSIKENWFHEEARQLYQERLKFGVAREQARKDLPLSTYTEAYWKCDLKNLLGFLRLRMDEHAQLEIRSYAKIIGEEIVAKLFPITWEAFVDYQLNAITFSGPEIEFIAWLNSSFKESNPINKLSKREKEEFTAKMKKMNINIDI